jgi:phage tail-like protein
VSSSGVPLGLSWAPSVLGNWVPGVRLMDPFPAFNFAIEIEALLVGGFTEVQGLESRVQTEDYREGGVNDFVHKLPVAAEHTNLVLRRGLSAASGLWGWYADTANGVIRRRNGTIMLLDRRQIPIMWWNFRNALPVSWTGPALNAGDGEVAFESIELAHQGLTVPLLGQAAALGHGIAGMAGA